MVFCSQPETGWQVGRWLPEALPVAASGRAAEDLPLLRELAAIRSPGNRRLLTEAVTRLRQPSPSRPVFMNQAIVSANETYILRSGSREKPTCIAPWTLSEQPFCRWLPLKAGRFTPLSFTPEFQDGESALCRCKQTDHSSLLLTAATPRFLTSSRAGPWSHSDSGRISDFRCKKGFSFGGRA